MKHSEYRLAEDLKRKLILFDSNESSLPGILEEDTCNAFIEQLIDSIRRVRYLRIMRSRDIAPARMNPSSSLFDPLKAAEIHRANGNLNEAFWLIFLATYCGKHGTSGWRLTRDLYGGLQTTETWSWDRVSTAPDAFGKWVSDSYKTLAGGDKVKRGFGNHRKYESLNPDAPRSPAKVIKSYVEWTGTTRNHSQLIQEAKDKTDAHPRSVFRYLYRSMNSVFGFGRLSRFDYLTMVGKMGLADIEADSAYMNGATGPYKGGCLLFKGSKLSSITVRELDQLFLNLGDYLEVGPQAMQVMEDAICNWQKSPNKYIRFNG